MRRLPPSVRLPSPSAFFSLAVLAAVAACGGSSGGDLFGPDGPAKSDPPAAAAPAPADPTASAPVPSASTPPPATPPTPATPSPVNPLKGGGVVTKVASGFGSLEGPVWRASAGALYFSDLWGNSIERFAPPSTFATYRFPSGGSNGLAVDAQGSLIACEGKNRRVTRTTTTGSVEIIAADWQGARLNAPNDVVVRSDGTLFFTDPDYSIQGSRELSFNGVYRVAPDRTMTLVADDLDKPNGVALSPDGSTLYVSDEAAGFLRAYDVATDGSTSNPRKWAEASHPDGVAVDDAGNVFVATLGGISVFAPDGSSWGTVDVPKQPANLAFGGANRKTLFITALDTLYSLELEVAGPP